MLDNSRTTSPDEQPLPKGAAAPLPIRNARRRLATGDSIFWREVGDQRPPLALLHGNWTDGSEWEALMAAYGPYGTCMAPDLLGFGESEAIAPKGLTIAAQVAALDELFRMLRWDQVWLVGNGIGAWTALTYGVTHPDRVGGIVVMDPEGLSLRGPAAKQQRRQLRAARSPLALATITLLKPLMGRRPSVQRTLALRQNLRQFPQTAQLLLRSRLALAAELLDERLQGVPFPVVLLEGEQPDPITSARGDALTLAVPHLRRERLQTGDRAFWQTEAPAIAAQLHQIVAPTP